MDSSILHDTTLNNTNRIAEYEKENPFIGDSVSKLTEIVGLLDVQKINTIGLAPYQIYKEPFNCTGRDLKGGLLQISLFHY